MRWRSLRRVLLIVAAAATGVATWAAVTGHRGPIFGLATGGDPGQATLEALGRTAR